MKTSLISKIILAYPEASYRLLKFKPVNLMARWAWKRLLDKPASLILHLTSSCNLDCRYCYTRRLHEPDREIHLPVDRTLKMIDEAKSMGIALVKLTGGEPTMAPAYRPALEKALFEGFLVALNTNGVIYDSALAELPEEWKKRLDITINFNHPDVFEDLIGTDEQFEALNENINRYRAAGLKVRLFSPITTRSIHRTGELFKKVSEKELPIIIGRYHPVMGSSEDDELILNSACWAELQSDLIRLQNECCSKKGRAPRRDPKQIMSLVTGSQCTCMVCDIVILSDGTAMPAALLPRDMALGNALSQSLEEIWKTYKLKRDKWRVIPEACQKCPHVKICGGGCKPFVYLKYGRFDVKDPHCNGNPPNTCRDWEL